MEVVIWDEGCRCKCGGCDIDLEHIYCKNLTWLHTYDTHAYMLMMWNLCGNDVAPMWWWCANWECIGNICSHVQVSKCAFPCLEVHNIRTSPLLGTHVPMLENIMCSHMGTPCFLPRIFVPLSGNIECSKLRFYCSHIPNMSIPMLVILNGNMGTKELQLDNVLFWHINMCSCMFPNMLYSDCILFSMFRTLYQMYLIFLMDLFDFVVLLKV